VQGGAGRYRSVQGGAGVCRRSGEGIRKSGQIVDDAQVVKSSTTHKWSNRRRRTSGQILDDAQVVKSAAKRVTQPSGARRYGVSVVVKYRGSDRRAVSPKARAASSSMRPGSVQSSMALRRASDSSHRPAINPSTLSLTIPSCSL
jgi:hypothetical protein